MNTQDIQAVIETAIETELVVAESADNVHFYITVVSTAFDGISKMKQHKMVLDLFREPIADERIHALSLKTYTPEKWASLSAETATEAN